MPNLAINKVNIQDTISTRAIEKLKRDMGSLMLSALEDPQTVELICNSDGILWQEKLGGKMEQIGTLRRAQAQAIIETIAGFHAKEVTKHMPILEGELPIDGSRFAGQLPPVVSSPTFAIRKKAVSVFTLEQYVKAQIMTEFEAEYLKSAIDKHKNILVIGGTGSGKTTLVNAIIDEMVNVNPHERLIIIEDTGEIQCKAINHVQFHTTSKVSMTDLLKTTLRMRPDRILVGEVRGSEALDLLMAWNTGHEGGCATLHANNARAGLDRLAMLISMHPNCPHPVQPLIAEAVHVVVHIGRTKNGHRRVQSILEVQGFENGDYITTGINNLNKPINLINQI